jgi:hypothetical protein
LHPTLRNICVADYKWALVLPRSYSVGKLEVLNVECDKCGRRGRYRFDRLIERYGIDAKLFEWSDEITTDCPRKQALAVEHLALS